MKAGTLVPAFCCKYVWPIATILNPKSKIRYQKYK